MLILGLRLSLIALVLFAVGFSGMGAAWLEVCRVSGAVVLGIAFVLILADFLRSAEPDKDGHAHS